MNKVYCKCCKYSTTDKHDMNKHAKTKKHEKNLLTYPNSSNTDIIILSKFYFCESCDKEFKSNTARKTHQSKCNPKVDSSNMMNMITMLSQQVSDLVAVNTKLTTANTEISNNAVNKTAEVATKSMSVLKYASLNYSDVPALKTLEKNEIYGLLNYGSGDELTEEEKEELNETYVKIVLAQYDNKNLINCLSDMVVEYFTGSSTGHKLDPKKMQVWSVDVARLSFIIMQKVNNEEENQWRNDKSGKIFTSMVIKPMFSTLNDILVNFIKYKTNWLDKNPKATTLQMDNIINLRQKCVELMKEIKYRHFEKSVLKLVAPSFKFDTSIHSVRKN
jgi:hypothetical protein